MGENQQRAANPAHSVWMNAHAGTGKTTVLVNRVLRLLLTGEAPSAILCITYTKAAAMEMQLRIRYYLKLWAHCRDAELNASLTALLQASPSPAESDRARRLLADILDAEPGLRVETIHAFCHGLLSQFALEAGVPPHFTLLDERSATALKQETVASLLDKAGTDALDETINDALAHLARNLSDFGLAKLLGVVMDKNRRFHAMLQREGGLKARFDQIQSGLGLAENTSHDASCDAFRHGHQTRRNALKEALGGLRKQGKNPQKLADAIEAFLNSSQDEMAISRYSGFYLTQDKEPRPKAVSSLWGKAFATAQPKLEAALIEEQAAAECWFKTQSALKIAEFNRALIIVADALLALYRTRKEMAGLLDHDDLLWQAALLLNMPGRAEWVMSRLDMQLNHLLLDEAQDTSPLQWQIAQRLVEELFLPELYEQRPRTLFVVGDHKQSIYSFQGADPERFRLMAHIFAEWFNQTGQPFYHLPLATSYRSSGAVLALVDGLCALPQMQIDRSDGAICHGLHRSGHGGLVELWPLCERQQADSILPWEIDAPDYRRGDSSLALIERITNTISGWIGKRQLTAYGRAVRAGDILILVQRRNDFMRQLSSALRHAGITVAGMDRLSLTGHIAIKDIIRLAEWCLFPADDLSLAIILKGPLFDWVDAALLRLCPERSGSLWQALEANEIYTDVAAQLQEIRQLALQLTPAEWLLRLAERYRLRVIFQARHGEEAAELLDELIAQAENFAQRYHSGLQGFVHWLSMSDSDIKREMEQAGDAVRILTVHGAKGLQAPIVILPDTLRVPDFKEILLWDEQEEGPICYALPAGVVRPPAIAALRQSMMDAQAAEYHRLLYVAVTRAADELYIGGFASGKSSPAHCWYQLAQDALSAMGVAPDTKGIWRHEVLQQAQLPAPQIVAGPIDHPLPDWKGREFPNIAIRRALSPSRVKISGPIIMRQGASGGSAQRGTMIHALLQYADATMSRDDLLHYACLLRNKAPHLDWEQMAGECAQVIAAHPQLFGNDALTEVTIAGELDGQLYQGIIDRLIITAESYHIIDYKSDSNPPDNIAHIAPSYLVQCAIYQALAAQLRQDKPIIVTLLYTHNAQAITLPDDVLLSHLPQPDLDVESRAAYLLVNNDH